MGSNWAFSLPQKNYCIYRKTIINALSARPNNLSK